MEPYYAGWLSLVPPVLAIALALVSKEVVSSLLVGIMAGTFIYSMGMGLNPIAGTVGTAFDLMVGSADLYIILFVCMLGGLVFVISMAGGSKAYGKWAATKIKSKRLSLLATALLGIVIFIDDYFNCLTVGTVMKPLTDKYKVSRAKLAYITVPQRPCASSHPSLPGQPQWAATWRPQATTKTDLRYSSPRFL